ncbi:MAG: hypothetical protein NUV55_07850 [Sulfuricaulis sp.]|uniref:hypothetical protein n=1 Tax=Sulfuricaulis sp. TaxID=2003553 RepID=UPI0025FCAB16|nr:hypothetical protein [Sulfuricaulis sp.]MCR4347097.1 hypothetical protein [Sulfuricaulis sp.]
MENGLTAGRCVRTSIITLFLMCFFAVPAYADDFSVLLNGKAIHLDSQPGVTYNENNWGVGFQYDMAPVQEKWVPFVTASEFKDSNKNTSYYFGGGFLHRTNFEWGKTSMHFDAGGIAFLMKRKGFKDGDLFPGILPVVSLGTSRVAVNMTFIPKVDPKMVPILFFQLKVTLGTF